MIWLGLVFGDGDLLLFKNFFFHLILNLFLDVFVLNLFLIITGGVFFVLIAHRNLLNYK